MQKTDSAFTKKKALSIVLTIGILLLIAILLRLFMPQEKKFDVINLTSKNFDLTNLEQIESVIKYNKADYLLHFAWITGGDYLSNSVNNILCKKIIY